MSLSWVHFSTPYCDNIMFFLPALLLVGLKGIPFVKHTAATVAKVLRLGCCRNLATTSCLLSCFQTYHLRHHLTTLPAPARNMKGTLMKFNSEVVQLSDEGITDVETYRSCLHTLHSQAVVEAKTNFVPKKNKFCTKQSPCSFTTRYLTT